MTFFTDFKVPKYAKIGITNLLGNITTKPHSHKGGWAKLLRCQLINEGYRDVKILQKEDKLDDFNCIVFDLGAEYSGSLNLFGGLDNKVYRRLVELYHYTGEYYSWQHELPSILPLEKRRANKSTCEEFKNADEDFIVSLQSVLTDCKVFNHVTDKSHLLIGDSHTPSVWSPHMEIYRKDGRTLFGSLKNDLFSEFDLKNEYAGVEEVTIYMGNIDVRHHLMRQDSPFEAVQKLAMDYIEQIESKFFMLKVNVIGLLSIENESRKLPKTGYYKDTPFYGKWNQRSALVEIFNQIISKECMNRGWQFVKFPPEFKNEIGELPFDVMERPQSVHISPMFYRWDLENNKRRW